MSEDVKPTENVEAPKPTPLQLLQSEYNELVGKLGHIVAQQMQLQNDEESVKTLIKSVHARAANLPKV